ncbi:MAG: hypothetical protein SOY33_05765 [Candidatus Onthovivens sp.]|nr:hypothetical protein [Bacilli bacterium]
MLEQEVFKSKKIIDPINKMKYQKQMIIIVFFLFLTIKALHLRNENKIQKSNLQNNLLTGQIDLTNLKKAESYKTFVDKLEESLKSKEFREALKEEFKTNAGQGILKCNDEAKIPVKNLSPTQTDIGLVDSLAYVLMPFDGEKEFHNYFEDKSQTIGDKIITFDGKWIIDGHHRWSQLYMVNPEALINAINCEYFIDNNKVNSENPLNILKIFQAAIGTITGGIKKAEAGENIYDCGDKNCVKKQVTQLLTSIIKDEKIEIKHKTVPIDGKKLKEKIINFKKNFNSNVERIEKGKENKNKVVLNNEEKEKIKAIYKNKFDMKNKKTIDSLIEELSHPLTEGAWIFVQWTKPNLDGASTRVSMPQTDYPGDFKNQKDLYGAPMVEPIHKKPANTKTAVVSLLKESAPKMVI